MDDIGEGHRDVGPACGGPCRFTTWQYRIWEKMSSSGAWLRVAAGLRKVAEAAAKQGASDGRVWVNRMTAHGADVIGTAASARTAHPPSERVTEDADHPLEQRFGGTRDSSTDPKSVVYPSDDNTNPDTSPITKDCQQDSNQDELLEFESDGSSTVVRDIESKTMKDTNDVSRRQPTSETSTFDMSRGGLDLAEIPSRMREGRPVPATRVGRAAGFASLGVGLVFGTAAELTSRLFAKRGGASSSSAVANDANADRLAATLCRMRGAALKMGQMLSIQDESLLPPALAKALQQVRQGAEAMPNKQLTSQMAAQLGPNWRDNYEAFDELPFAAASIGQVHQAKIRSDDSLGDKAIREVVVKVQYPGVSSSIESDLRNLTMLVKLTGIAPKGLFIDNVIRVGREELKVECNYLREMQNQQKFQELVAADETLRKENFHVPRIVKDLTTREVITSEFCPGGTIDKVVDMSQKERNRIGRTILYLTIQELFVWRFMQTDPNWGNFLYDPGSLKTYLIDFGAAREYPKSFVDGYLRIVVANANRDTETLMDLSHKMKFLTGEENDIMLEAHRKSGFTVGEPFCLDTPFDFRASNISSRLSEHSAAFMQHRLTPPPEEVYTLHRKLAGAYNLCIKLGSVVNCREMLRAVVEGHKFEDGMEPPRVDFTAE